MRDGTAADDGTDGFTLLQYSKGGAADGGGGGRLTLRERRALLPGESEEDITREIDGARLQPRLRRARRRRGAGGGGARAGGGGGVGGGGGAAEGDASRKRSDGLPALKDQEHIEFMARLRRTINKLDLSEKTADVVDAAADEPAPKGAPAGGAGDEKPPKP